MAKLILARMFEDSIANNSEWVGEIDRAISALQLLRNVICDEQGQVAISEEGFTVNTPAGEGKILPHGLMLHT
jgi:hypothetical protein